PGELVGELDGPVVGALRCGAVPAEGEGRYVLAAVPQRRRDVDLRRGQPEQRAHVLAKGRHVSAGLVDEVPAKVRRERRHDTAAPLRAPGAGGGQGEGAHVGRLLRDPVPVEAQGDGVHGRQLPVEAQQAERIVAGAVVAAPQAIVRARRVVVKEPCGVFVPLRVVDATRPPENWPRATSKLFVTTRTARTASWGTSPEPSDMPSSVTLLAVGRWPAT